MNKHWSESELKGLQEEFSNISLLPDYFENKYNVPWRVVSARARCLGLRRGKAETRRTKAFYLPKEEIIACYQAGDTSLRQIAAKYRCTFPTISTLLKKHGIRVKTNVETQTIYKVDGSYFNKIDSHVKAYWLGWMITDGSVSPNGLSLTLQARDHEIIRLFKKSLQSEHPIDYICHGAGDLKKNGELKEYVGVIIMVKELASALAEYGVMPNKVFKVEFPSKLSEEYYPSFIAGAIEGDGSVKIGTTFKLTGTFKFINAVQDILIKNCNLNKTKIDILPNGITSNFCYCGSCSCLKYFNYAYANLPICLRRKYLRFMNMFEKTHKVPYINLALEAFMASPAPVLFSPTTDIITDERLIVSARPQMGHAICRRLFDKQSTQNSVQSH